ncbi:hypothetical protein BN8_01345 [Fibrisoma limi BUZ 3]|uniref:Uncharacterized protein n=1 Tax=Fibrisoma limi BUZ 3 TaxID=1185876 RepID=I2GEM4_9BACT|nr:hypothetical protein [Fibrisoma limi]CCH52349.1 hypothetical protein BN8_01345 [Fibrisoma limi BUZ 3]
MKDMEDKKQLTELVKQSNGLINICFQLYQQRKEEQQLLKELVERCKKLEAELSELVLNGQFKD